VHDTNDAVAGPSGPKGDGGARPDDASTVFLFAVVLTLGTGAMNVAVFTRLGSVFASVMTGNLVVLGLAAERLSATLATHTLIAIAGYVAGVAAGARLVPAGRLPGWRMHRVIPVLLVEFVLLAGFTVGWELTGTRPHGASQLILLAIATAAMGTQSTAARDLSSRVSTTYLTGTLTTVISELVTRGDRRVQWREASQIVAMAVGAALGGLVLAVAPGALPAVPLVALAAVIGLIATLEPPPGGDRQQWVARRRQP
jgi:uncharacterized membrane protein YoaK (UPF0700 family)